MELLVIRRFLSMPEAWVACSALQSAGVDAVLLDANFGAVSWTHIMYLGGVRLAVPRAQWDDAVLVLGVAPAPQPAPPVLPDLPRFSFFLLLSFIGGPLAWSWALRKDLAPWRRVVANVLSVLLVLLMAMFSFQVVAALGHRTNDVAAEPAFGD